MWSSFTCHHKCSTCTRRKHGRLNEPQKKRHDKYSTGTCRKRREGSTSRNNVPVETVKDCTGRPHGYTHGSVYVWALCRFEFGYRDSQDIKQNVL